MQMDFAEDYNIQYSEEVQSAYFAKEKAIIHPMYTMYKDKDGVIHKDSDVFITNNPKHHADSVRVFQKNKLNQLRAAGVKVTRCISWTDGAACQYKGKTSFRDIGMSELPTELGVPHERHFFETSHGKSRCDPIGRGGVAKCNVWRHTLQKKTTVTNALDFYTYSKL